MYVYNKIIKISLLNPKTNTSPKENLLYNITMKILSIDPSILSLGIAIFDVNMRKKSAVLFCTKQISVPKKLEKAHWIDKLDHMVEAVMIKAAVRKSPPDIVLIELPQVFTVGRRGGAAGNSESIMKLSSFVFAVRQELFNYVEVVKLIPVRTWKGQMPKSLTASRVKKHWGFTSQCDDIVDAVGIGNYWIREIMRFKSTVR